MKTVNTLLSKQNFTELETKVMGQLNEELKGNFGETFSDVECKDLAKALNLEVATIKGVVGSLVKKGVLDTYDGRLNRGDAQLDLVYFKEQEIMEYEPIATAIKPAPEQKVPQAKNIGLVYNPTKNEVRNTMGALICECLPSVIDGAYAGNYQVRMQEMVDAWNATVGVGINPSSVIQMLEALKHLMKDTQKPTHLSFEEWNKYPWIIAAKAAINNATK